MHVLNVVQLVLMFMKSKDAIKNKLDAKSLIKETKEQRLQRIQSQKFLGTQMIDCENKYSRKQKHKKKYEDI